MPVRRTIVKLRMEVEIETECDERFFDNPVDLYSEGKIIGKMERFKEYGCFVDALNGNSYDIFYPDCVFNTDDDRDCNVTGEYNGKEDCPFWLPVGTEATS